MVLQTRIFFFWSTTFLEPDFSNQISQTTFLEPLLYTFLEKWLQIKCSIGWKAGANTSSGTSYPTFGRCKLFIHNTMAWKLKDYISRENIGIMNAPSEKMSPNCSCAVQWCKDVQLLSIYLCVRMIIT